MRKNLFIIICFVFYTALSFANVTEAVTISVISSSDLNPYKQTLEGLKEYFADKGVYLKLLEYNLKMDEPDQIIQQIFQEKPDIVYTIGTNATKLAKEKIKNTQIVFSMVLHSETFINSNVVGVSLNIPAKIKLENIRRILPSVKRIGVIYSSKSTKLFEEVHKASKEIGFQLISKHINSKNKFSKLLKDISSEVDCFLVIPDTEIYIPQTISHLILKGLRKGFAVIGLSSFHTKAGALVSFEGDYFDMGRQAGGIALRIVNGEKFTHSQLTMPEKTKFSLNIRVAERLKIDIPSKELKEASEVFGK